MRVILNGLAALKPKTGVGHYVARLHAAMQSEVAIYPGELSSRLARRLQQPGSGKPRSGSRFGVPTWGTAFLKHLGKTAVGIHFARHCRAMGYQLYHEPNFIPFSTSLPTIITVHDLSVIRFPQWHPEDRVRHHQHHFERAVRRAEHIITVSETVREELLGIMGISPGKVTAILNGVGEEFAPIRPEFQKEVRQRLHLPERYFLVVGTIEPRKNILTALKAFADLPSHVREHCPLVLAGPWGWKSEPEREFLAANPNHVRHLGYVAAEDLPAVYSGANVLLYPSHYEGFGLPPAEMLACGGAVFASRKTHAVREVLGTHAEWLDAGDVSAWREAMLRAATEPEYLTQLRRGGVRHSQQFTWTRTAHETLAVYRKVLGLPAQHEQVLLRTAA